MDVSGDAQSLGAALNHSALNVANALGAWLGGLVIAAGFGYPSTAVVGAVLAAGGLVVVGLSHAAERAAARRDAGTYPSAPQDARALREPVAATD
jgi:DHA1 family inner membrane transport protein